MRILVFLMIQISLATGHGDLHEQITKVSAQIIATPDDPKLWLARADLHQSHRNPKAAHLDLQQATRLKPPHPPAFLKLATFERKHDQIPSAKKSLEAYFQLIASSSPDPQAHRERALLSSPRESIKAWRLFLKGTASPALYDYVLASEAALKSGNHVITREFILDGLKHHPKSIRLHQTHAQISLAKGDSKTAETTFKTLELLYPNLLVKLNYEESRIWTQHQKPARAQEALLAALQAFNKTPSRLQKNRDLQNLVAKIRTALRK